MERGNDLNSIIKDVAEKFIEKIKGREIFIVSHFDTDGITSASIMIQALKRMDAVFSVKILKSLEDDFIFNLPKKKIIIFLDLASGSLSQLEQTGIEDIFIIDHHEVIQQIPKNIHMINPEINGKEKISSSGLVYLFCREIDEKNTEFAKLAVLGMIGDLMEKNIDKINNEILKEGDVKRKRGLLIYPSTRPINRVLEYCSDPYIQGVSGNIEGVNELLKEAGINPLNGKYKSIIELEELEMSKLITGIMLRSNRKNDEKVIGDIFLLKFFNKLEDARELSAMINACSRLGNSELAVELCMEIPRAKKRAEKMHVKYKQFIVSGLRTLSESEKTAGNEFIIINAKDKIKDTIIGTLATILSKSSVYPDGTIIITMAHYDSKIKISCRAVGECSRNLREILNEVVKKTGGNVGGHQNAAGCIILKEKESEFIELMKKGFEVELVKV